MGITKDYEGSEIVADTELANKPIDHTKTIDALIEFTLNCETYFKHFEQRANAGEFGDTSLEDTFKLQNRVCVEYLKDAVPQKITQEIITGYFDRIHEVDSAKLYEYTHGIAPILVQRAYSDGVNNIVLNAHDHTVLDDTLLVGLVGTPEEPLRVVLKTDGYYESLACQYAAIIVEGRPPSITYYDESNMYTGAPLDVLKQVASQQTAINTLFVVDEDGTIVSREGDDS